MTVLVLVAKPGYHYSVFGSFHAVQERSNFTDSSITVTLVTVDSIGCNAVDVTLFPNMSIVAYVTPWHCIAYGAFLARGTIPLAFARVIMTFTNVTIGT